MVERRVVRLIALAAVLPLAGCMSFSRSKTGGAETAALEPGKPEKELPPAEAARLCLVLADEMEKNGNDAEAAQALEKARQSDPKLKVSRRLGIIYERLDMFDQAKREYERVLQENPKDAQVYSDLGYLHYSKGRWDEAEANLRAAVQLDPKNTTAWNNLGMTLGHKGQYLECLSAFKNAVREPEAFSNLGYVLMIQGKREEAKRAYREALSREPDLRVAQAALALLERPPQQPQAQQVARAQGATAGQ